MKLVLVVLTSVSVFLVSQTSQLRAQGMFLKEDKHGFLLNGGFGLSEGVNTLSLTAGYSLLGVLDVNGILGKANYKNVTGESVSLRGFGGALYLSKPKKPKALGVVASGAILRSKASYRGDSDTADSGTLGITFYGYEEIKQGTKFFPSLGISRSMSLEEGNTPGVTSITAGASILVGLQTSRFVLSPAITLSFAQGGSTTSFVLSAGVMVGK